MIESLASDGHALYGERPLRPSVKTRIEFHKKCRMHLFRELQRQPARWNCVGVCIAFVACSRTRIATVKSKSGQTPVHCPSNRHSVFELTLTDHGLT